MYRYIKIIIGISAFLALASSGIAAQAPSILADQFGAKLDISETLKSGTCIVLAGNAMNAPARLYEWRKLLLASALSEARIILVCDLSGMPFFVPKTPTINKLQKEYPETSVYLDWKGEFSKRFSIQKAGIVVELYKEGLCLARLSGDADAAKIPTLQNAR